MKNRAKRRSRPGKGPAARPGRHPTANAGSQMDEAKAVAIWWKLQDALSNLGRKRLARNPK